MSDSESHLKMHIKKLRDLLSRKAWSPKTAAYFGWF